MAQALLARVELHLRHLGCRAITLDTTRPLTRAIRFYEANGFRATGEVQASFGVDLLPYRKELAYRPGVTPR